MKLFDDTIIGISTALSKGAISIIRLSGDDAIKIVNKVFKGIDLSKVEPNTINYGHGMYGIENASQFYFGKKAKDLDLAEAAILTGIPKSPSNYSPLVNYKKAKARQELILKNLLKEKKITTDAYNEAVKEKLRKCL